MKFLNEAPNGKTLNLRRNGFVVAPEENFSDDGNYFKGYYYDPEKKGDKRFRTSKLVSDGDAYISVRYYDDETGKTTFFNDLNGVRYDYAVDHIKELTDKIDAFKAKLDAGEIKPRELSDEDIQNIKDKAKQLMSLSDMNYYQALDTIYKKLGIDSYDLRKEIRDKISKEVESEVRNTREDNPVLVKALAKKMLQDVMKAIKGTSGSYNSRGKWTSGNAPKSLEDALEINSDVSTYSGDAEAKELIDAGLQANKLYWMKDLTDANQERIRSWVKNKIETLYDFE